MKISLQCTNHQNLAVERCLAEGKEKQTRILQFCAHPFLRTAPFTNRYWSLWSHQTRFVKGSRRTCLFSHMVTPASFFTIYAGRFKWSSCSVGSLTLCDKMEDNVKNQERTYLDHIRARCYNRWHKLFFWQAILSRSSQCRCVCIKWSHNNPNSRRKRFLDTGVSHFSREMAIYIPRHAASSTHFRRTLPQGGAHE